MFAPFTRTGDEVSSDDPENIPPTIPARSVRIRNTETAEPALPFEANGRYENAREIGRGGIGKVTSVTDAHLHREVALKELLPEALELSKGAAESAMARFVREARITAQLEHPGVVPVHELARRNDGTLYYAMKQVRGRTLAEALADCGSLQDRLTLLPHLLDVFQTIAFAHERRVVHRDLKPANVMVGAFGETFVLDWGLARVKSDPEAAPSVVPILKGDAFETQSGQALGTPAYMSPEQALGKLEEIDEQSDVWSLGAMLYELLTGKTPFDGVSLSALLVAIVRGDIPPMAALEPNAPKALVEIAEKALNRDRAQRWPSAAGMAQALEAAVFGTYEPIRRSVTSWVLAAGVLAAVATGALWLWREGERHDAALEREARIQQELHRSLAAALAEQAQLKLATGNVSGARVAAREALTNAPNPLAQGVLMQSTFGPQPQMHWSVVTPHGCVAVAQFKETVACATLGGVDLYDEKRGAPNRLSQGVIGWQRHVLFIESHLDEPPLRGPSWVVAIGDDRVLRAWPDGSGRPPRIMGPLRSQPAALVLSPAGTEVIAFGKGGDLLRWKFEEDTAEEVQLPFGGITDAVWCSNFAIAVATTQNAVQLNAKTLKSLSVRPGAVRRAVCGNDAVIDAAWFLKKGAGQGGSRAENHIIDEAALNGAEITALTDTPIDNTYWLGDANGNVYVRSGARQRLLASFGTAIQDLAMSQNGSDTDGAIATADRKLQAWSWPTQTKQRPLRTFTDRDVLRQLSALQDGTLLAVRAEGPSALFTTVNDAPKIMPELLQVSALDASGTQEAPRIVAAFENGTVRSLDSPAPWTTEPRPATALASSADGSKAAWALDNGTLVLWSVPFGKEITRVKEELTRALAFNPGGTVLAAARGRRIVLFDAQTGEQKRVLEGHADEVMALRWLLDGRLLSAGADGQLRQWSVAAGSDAVVMAMSDVFTVIAASDAAQPKWVACASRRGIVYVWNLQENRLYAEVRLTTGKIIALIFSGEDRLTVVAQSGAVTELPL